MCDVCLWYMIADEAVIEEVLKGGPCLCIWCYDGSWTCPFLRPLYRLGGSVSILKKSEFNLVISGEKSSQFSVFWRWRIFNDSLMAVFKLYKYTCKMDEIEEELSDSFYFNVLCSWSQHETKQYLGCSNATHDTPFCLTKCIRVHDAGIEWRIFNSNTPFLRIFNWVYDSWAQFVYFFLI